MPRVTFASLIAIALATNSGVPAAARDAVPPIVLPDRYEGGLGQGAPTATAPWWSAYGDPALAPMIARLHAANTTIAQARARLAAAEAAMRAGRASQRPFVSGDASATSARGPLINAAGESGDLYSGRITVGWEPDVLGRLSSDRAAERSDAAAAAALLDDTRLLMEGRLVQSWLSVRALTAALIDADRAVALLREARAIAAQRRSNGQIALTDVDSAQARLDAALQRQSDLVMTRAAAAREAGFLLGETAPAALAADTEAAVQLPEIAAGLPSDLLLRRPDIAAARNRVAAADQRLASARDGWMPVFSLTASGGTASSSLGQILSGGAANLLLGALLSIPVFDGGRQKARVAGRRADVDLAEAQYRETVLGALRDVNNQLQAYEECRSALSREIGQERSASTVRDAARGRYENGTIGRLAVIEAETLVAERSLARKLAELRCYSTSVAALRSLAGPV